MFLSCGAPVGLWLLQGLSCDYCWCSVSDFPVFTGETGLQFSSFQSAHRVLDEIRMRQVRKRSLSLSCPVHKAGTVVHRDLQLACFAFHFHWLLYDWFQVLCHRSPCLLSCEMFPPCGDTHRVHVVGGIWSAGSQTDGELPERLSGERWAHDFRLQQGGFR